MFAVFALELVTIDLERDLRYFYVRRWILPEDPSGLQSFASLVPLVERAARLNTIITTFQGLTALLLILKLFKVSFRAKREEYGGCVRTLNLALFGPLLVRLGMTAFESVSDWWDYSFSCAFQCVSTLVCADVGVLANRVLCGLALGG